MAIKNPFRIVVLAPKMFGLKKKKNNPGDMARSSVVEYYCHISAWGVWAAG